MNKWWNQKFDPERMCGSTQDLETHMLGIPHEELTVLDLNPFVAIKNNVRYGRLSE